MIVGFRPCGCWAMVVTDMAPPEDMIELIEEARDAGLRLGNLSDESFKTAPYQCPVCRPEAFGSAWGCDAPEPIYSRVQLEQAGQLTLGVA